MDAAFYKSIDIPIEYYLMALILMLMIGVVDFHEKRDILLSVARAFLFGYIFLVFSSTVIAREVKADYNYNMGLFWSYAAVKEGRKYLFFLNIANIVMLMPVGFLASYIRSMNCRKAALLGFGTSSVIEVLQLILKRGMFEFDDIFHNTLGCMMGYFVYKFISMLGKWREK